MLFRNQDNANQRTRRTVVPIVPTPERPDQEATNSSIKLVDLVNPSFLA